MVLIIGDAPAPVAAGHRYGHICIHPVGGQGPQGQAQLRGFFADIGGVVIHQLGKGGLGGVAALIQGEPQRPFWSLADRESSVMARLTLMK